MKLRTISTFTTTIPDDTQWRDDEISVPGGEAIAYIVRDYLRAIGAACSDPGLRDSYGWELLAEFGGHRFLVVVQLVDEWILHCEPFANSQNESTSAFLKLISKCLTSNQQFSNVRWYFSDDFDKGDLSKDSGQPC